MSEESSQINSYRIPKIPPFWINDPETWFIAVEASFQVARITDDTTKYHSILANFDATILSHIKDLVHNPPAESKYDTLKERILGAFSVSQATRLRQLFKGQILGDKKPSHFLQELKNLAGNQCSDSVIKTLFVEQLPENYRTILATVEEPDLTKFANIADKISESLSLSNTIAPVEASNSHDSRAIFGSANIDDKTIDLLARRIGDKLKLRIPRARSKQSQRPFSASRSRSGSRYRSKICFYHGKFGARAQKCRKPCNWRSTSQSSQPFAEN